jgi:hypothetical protein
MSGQEVDPFSAQGMPLRRGSLYQIERLLEVAQNHSKLQITRANVQNETVGSFRVAQNERVVPM